MAEKQRKLTKKEQKRLELIQQKRAELEAEGFVYHEKLFGAVYINVVGALAMIPYELLMLAVFICINASTGKSWQAFRMRNYFPSFVLFMIAFLISAAVLVVIHELIHGICFAHFVKGGWESVDFGFNTTAFAPYCTCSEPLTKRGYIISALMPTIVLGFIPCIASAFTGNSFILLLGLTLIFGGAGDFMMVYSMLKIKTKNRDVLFIDHPTEIGSMYFIRETEKSNLSISEK